MATKKSKELEKSDLEFIEGEFVNVRQSTIRAVEGGHVELQQVGALSIDSERIEMTQGATALIRAHNVNLNQSISAVNAADHMSVNFSLTPVSLSRGKTEVNSSAVGTMAAKEIHSNNSTAFLAVASRIDGNMTTILDWRSALALGAVFGGIWGLLSLLFKRK